MGKSYMAKFLYLEPFPSESAKVLIDGLNDYTHRITSIWNETPEMDRELLLTAMRKFDQMVCGLEPDLDTGIRLITKFVSETTNAEVVTTTFPHR